MPSLPQSPTEGLSRMLSKNPIAFSSLTCGCSNRSSREFQQRLFPLWVEPQK
jgi:hypothetical protein